MDMPFYLSVLIGFVPSFAILYLVWGKFEGVFKEKRLFWNYFVGWILGILVGVFFLILKYSSAPYLDISLLFVLFFAIFTATLKFMYLNFPKKLKDYQLPYNGFSLGLGIAALWSIAISYQYLTYYSYQGYELALLVVSLFLFSVGLSAMQASSGAIMGFEIYKKYGFLALYRPILYEAVFNLTLLPIVWNLHPLYYFLGIFVAVPILYYKVYKGVLYSVLPAEVKRKWAKEREG